MEAMGVFWIALYEMLERNGIGVCLVNPKEVKQVKGRKTDVKDCQWIQKLFSAGLLRESHLAICNDIRNNIFRCILVSL
jgi:transposase